MGITDKTPDPSKASYCERDANGKLTGGIVEQAALEPVRQKLREIAKANYLKNTEKVMADYAQLGVTSVVNMGLSNTNKNILSFYKHISAEHPTVLGNANTWLVGIPNCGHNMVYEKPLEVTELITAFIKK